MKLSTLLVLATFVTAPLCAADCKNPTLRAEILMMVVDDQKARANLSPVPGDAQIAEMNRVDALHAVRVRQIVKEFGWPGKSLVGDDGARGIWLLVQHFEIADQDEYLPLMERAVSTGEAEAKNYVYLLDRVRIRHGQPQLYGTQYHGSESGEWIREPIEDPAHLDDRRKKVGLLPLAEFEKTIPNAKIRAN
jgi:hypothetical protein